MDCEQVRTELEAFEAGELAADEAADVAAHLAGCPACEVERTGLAELAAELRHAGGAVRPLQPFTLPVVAVARPRRRTLAALALVAAAWAILLTTAMLWPALAAHLTFLPVGRHLSAAPTQPAAATSAGGGGGYSLADAPRQALAAAAAVFASPPLTRAPSQAVPSAELIRLLPDALDGRPEAVSLVSVGPVVSIAEGRIQVVATVDLTPRAQAGTAQPRRHRLLVTLTRDAQGQWRVTRIDAPGE